MDLERLAQLIEDGPMPLVRTDFSSDDAWRRVVDEVTEESDLGEGDRYAPNVEAISDHRFEGTTVEGLASSWSRAIHGYVLLADERTMSEAVSDGELTVVLVDLHADEEDEQELGAVFGGSFRCEAGEVASIEANLSIANMDFADFAEAVDADGVFRGF